FLGLESSSEFLATDAGQVLSAGALLTVWSLSVFCLFVFFPTLLLKLGIWINSGVCGV
ncbi:hypothetical protein LEMLEM_LOCUS7044, partial [Lemmus lemmus]